MIIRTLAQLHELVGFDPGKEFKRSHRVIKRAHRNKSAQIRLKAAELNLRLADAFPKEQEQAESSRPVSVTINLSSGSVSAIEQGDSPLILDVKPLNKALVSGDIEANPAE